MPQGRRRLQPGVVLNKKKLDVVIQQHSRLSLVDSIFEMVVAQIQLGNVTLGQRLHSVRQLADECEVSRDTVARAYDKLVAHGFIESRAGSGFYVKHPARPSTGPEIHSGGLDPAWWRFRLVQPADKMDSTTGYGQLPSEWMDEAAIGSALRTMARASHRGLSGHSDPLGYLPLRQQLQTKLRGVQIKVPIQQMMITMGASDALNLVVLALVRKQGEFVLVEQPGPFLLVDRLMAAGLNPVAVQRGPDGPDLAQMRELCERYRPRFFFCSSILQNPTSTQLAPDKAFQILRLADEFDFTIVEDDTYSDLLPVTVETSVTRLATLDQLRRVIYIGSLSKTIAPGLRTGFICANPAVMDWLVVYRTVSHISGSPIAERAVYQLLSDGSYRHHCGQLRSRLDELRQPVAEQLRAIGCAVEHMPDAGMYVWATLPGRANAEQIAETMYQHGHLMAPGSLFSTNAADLDKMRFNISRTLDSPALPMLAKLLRPK